MKMKSFALLGCLGILMLSSTVAAQTDAVAEQMQWFKDAKFGMFIHFQAPRSGDFDPSNLDTAEWVRIAKAGGMKYITLTTSQSSYVPLWKSSFSDRDVTDRTSFKRDIVKELSVACKAGGIKMGCYYPIADPPNPLYNEDGSDIAPYVDYLYGMIKELCENYQPCLIWFDASRRFRNPAAKPFLRQQDMVDMMHSYGTLSNSRLGDDDALQYVDYLTMNDNMAPDFNLGVYWESAVTITARHGVWHYNPSHTELKTPQELLHRLINAAGNGGNLLLNVGPDHEGAIPEEVEARLKTMGQWLEKNGEAIYGTQAGPYPHKISWGSITQRTEAGKTSLYLNVLDWPETGTFTLFGLNNKVLNVSLLATGEAIGFKSKFDSFSGQQLITLDIPQKQPDDYVSVIKLVVAGDAVMDQGFLQLTDGKVLMEAYNARIRDVEPIPNKPTKAIDMKMFTVPDRRPMQPSDYQGPWDYQMYKKPGEGIMPGRALTVSGFQTKGQALSWDFKVYEPGLYDVVVVCHAGSNMRWEADDRVRATVAGQSVEHQLVEAKRVATISKLSESHYTIGTVKLEHAGAHSLTLELTSDFTGAKPNVRSVMLVPTIGK